MHLTRQWATSDLFSDKSVFSPGGNPQAGFRRSELMPGVNNGLDVTVQGITTFHFSIKEDIHRPLNYSHQYEVSVLCRTDFESPVDLEWNPTQKYSLSLSRQTTTVATSGLWRPDLHSAPRNSLPRMLKLWDWGARLLGGRRKKCYFPCRSGTGRGITLLSRRIGTKSIFSSSFQY